MRVLETERLIGRLPTLDDLGDWLALFRDPQVMATLRGVRPDAEIVQHLRDTITYWERHGHGIWMFCEKTSGEFVGRCGLRNQKVAGAPETELGYTVRAEYWNKRFATEMARAALDDGFTRFNYPSVVAFTLPTNTRSLRVMEKRGFVYERDIVWADLPHVLYRLNAPA